MRIQLFGVTYGIRTAGWPGASREGWWRCMALEAVLTELLTCSQTWDLVTSGWPMVGWGVTVPPENPELATATIRRAVSDDALVDHASEVNAQVVRERPDENLIRPRFVATYERVVDEGARRGRCR